MAKPSWGARAAAALFYMGLGPVFRVCRPGRRSRFETVHLAQSLLLFALLGAVFLTIVGMILCLSVAMVYNRDMVESWPAEVWLISAGRKLLIVWLVFWGYGLLRAVCGSAMPVPYMRRLLRCRRLRCGGVAILMSAYTFALVFAPLVIAAEAQLTNDTEAGRVFLVYEDLNQFPRAMFSLVMYPAARAACARYGEKSTVLLRISRDAIIEAANHGALVIIASHGTASGLLLDDGFLMPEEMPPLRPDTPLRFVYLAGCDSGAQREAWERAFHPATVKTYDRLTPVVEHAWWMLTQAPKLIRTLP